MGNVDCHFCHMVYRNRARKLRKREQNKRRVLISFFSVAFYGRYNISRCICWWFLKSCKLSCWKTHHYYSTIILLCNGVDNFRILSTNKRRMTKIQKYAFFHFTDYTLYVRNTCGFVSTRSPHCIATQTLGRWNLRTTTSVFIWKELSRLKNLKFDQKMCAVGT